MAPLRLSRRRRERASGSKKARSLPVQLWPSIRRKIDMLAFAANINDLRVPPSNHLEALKGNRAGQHSIKVNDQYRICFRWEGGAAYEIACVDYH
ncbi:MAG: type II toxin-antitoxin system RelE/ParE family toxin [Chloroflexota bacterium]